jgi:hypothetical protein
VESVAIEAAQLAPCCLPQRLQISSLFPDRAQRALIAEFTNPEQTFQKKILYPPDLGDVTITDR